MATEQTSPAPSVGAYAPPPALDSAAEAAENDAATLARVAVRRWKFITALVGALGAAGGARYLRADPSPAQSAAAVAPRGVYVDSATYVRDRDSLHAQLHALGETVGGLVVAVDGVRAVAESTSVRVRQIQCGERVARGCR